MSANRPRTLKRIVNSIVDAYFVQHEEREAVLRKSLINELDLREQMLDEKLKGLRRDVVRLAGELTGRGPVRSGRRHQRQSGTRGWGPVRHFVIDSPM